MSQCLLSILKMHIYLNKLIHRNDAFCTANIVQIIRSTVVQ